MELILEELVVFFLFDIGLILRPERLHGVQRAAFDGLNLLSAFDFLAFIVLRRFFMLEVHLDGVAHIIAVLLDEAFQRVVFRKVAFGIITEEFLAQRNRDARAALVTVTFFNAVGTVTRGFPTRTFLFACLAGFDDHFFGNHECRVETNTELTDEFLVGIAFAALAGFLGFFELFHKCLGAGLGNGTDIFNHFLTAHADTIIANGQGMIFLIRFEEDFVAVVTFQNVTVGQAGKMHLVNRIGCVGDKLPQENLVIRVNGMNHEVQQLFGFRLKFMGFFSHVFTPLFYEKYLYTN